jgi:nucleoside-diphosphate-sugar epimerase
MKNIIVTGCAGFIAYHLSEYLLQNGYRVIGVDDITVYYDIHLKESRLDNLKKHRYYDFYKVRIEDTELLLDLFGDKPETFCLCSKVDVPSTWSDTQLLKEITGYTPSTNIREGVSQFIN